MAWEAGKEHGRTRMGRGKDCCSALGRPWPRQLTQLTFGKVARNASGIGITLPTW